jgi:hypothetical protein
MRELLGRPSVDARFILIASFGLIPRVFGIALRPNENSRQVDQAAGLARLPLR